MATKKILITQAASKVLSSEEVKMEPVSSSAVAALGYNGKRKVMYVDWHKGGRYEYPGVSKELYENVKGSNSIGETMNYVKRSITGRKA